MLESLILRNLDMNVETFHSRQMNEMFLCYKCKFRIYKQNADDLWTVYTETPGFDFFVSRQEI